MIHTFDVLIVGGGISGVSLAARLAGRLKVGLAEAEENLGTHATGRSAALLTEAYGPAPIRELTRNSRRFFEEPPEGFADFSLTKRRGSLIYAAAGDVERLRHEFEVARDSAPVEWLDAAGVMECCPLLRKGVAAAGYIEPNSLDLDANGLLQGFARMAKRAGAVFLRSAPVAEIARTASGWSIVAGEAEVSCGVLVNAAGPWADGIAALAGAEKCGLLPLRRTAARLRAPDDLLATATAMPFVAPIDDSFYFRPDAAGIMVSLSDETPSDPCDAWPEDLDVALALERFHEATIVPRARPTAAWAGLRTFAKDRIPVVGFDAQAQGFFWYAGQGGYGIQTSPALSGLGAKLLMRCELTDDEARLAAALRPDRDSLAA